LIAQQRAKARCANEFIFVSIYKMTILVGLVGLKGAGKSAVADAFLNNHNDWQKTAFAAPLKAGLQCMFGFSEAQMHNAALKEVVDDRYGITPRQAMQVVGTDLMRHELERRLGIQALWVKRMDQYLTAAAERGCNVVVEDVRFPDEVACIQRHGGKIVHVMRATPTLLETAAATDATELGAAAVMHESESYVDTLPCEIVLLNSGSLEDLSEKALALRAQLTG
jgi:hypothetical protein